MTTQTRSNMVKMWLYSALSSASTAFLSVLTAYYIFCGLTDLQISFQTSLSSIVVLAFSLFCSGISSGVNNSRKVLKFLGIFRGAVIVVYSIFCFWHIPASPFYVVMLCISVILGIEAALATIFTYKYPCEVLEMEQYSVYVGYSGLFNGLLGIIIGFTLPILFRYIDFMLLTCICILLAALCCAVGGIIVATMKPLPAAEQAEKEPKQKISVNPIHDMRMLLKNRDFLAMLIPNFIRGFGSSVVSLIALIAVRDLSMAEGDIPLITSVASIGTLLSSFLYIFLTKHFGTPITGLIGSLLFGTICFSTMWGVPQFLVIYGIASIGNIILANAIPNMVYQTVDPSIISPFHTWRLALGSLGTAISTPIYGAFIGVVPGYILLLAGTLFTFLCAFGYYIYYRKRLGKQGK